MKKKGFTLIELLAVIVILAIIAVITVPKIADMISSSRQGGAEDSFYGTLKAAELGYTKALQSNTNLKGSICTIEDSKINCTNGVKIDISGKTPESGTLTIDSAGGTIAAALTLNGYKCYGDLSTEDPCVKENQKSTIDYLLPNLTLSGDGLYKDEDENNSYVFKGINPNNYLVFNNEIWRIIRTEADNSLKIVRDSSIGQMAWDTINSNWKRPADLNKFLNNNFYSTLSEQAKDKTLVHSFNIGGIKYVSGQKFGEDINQIKSEKWQGNVGLPDVLDYIKASLHSNCNNFYSAASEPRPCKNQNYLYRSTGSWWLINKNGKEGTELAWYVSESGNIFSYNGVSFSTPAVYPVLYLKANLQLDGNGTSSDPYKIK